MRSFLMLTALYSKGCKDRTSTTVTPLFIFSLMDSTQATINACQTLKRHLLSLARRQARIRGVQKSDPRVVSERINSVRDPAYRPTSVLTTGDTGEWITQFNADRRHGPRVLVRDRSVEYVSCDSKDASQKVSGTGNVRVANLGPRTVIMRSIQPVQGQRSPGDRGAQLSGVRGLQRETESVHRSRFFAQDKQEMDLLLRRRSERQSVHPAIHTALIFCLFGSAVYVWYALTSLFSF